MVTMVMAVAGLIFAVRFSFNHSSLSNDPVDNYSDRAYDFLTYTSTQNLAVFGSPRSGNGSPVVVPLMSYRNGPF